MTAFFASLPRVQRWLARGPARFLLVAAVLLWSAAPNRAQAGGLYLMPRGAGPAARGGASVAGVRDPHALWYNPAGLVASKNQLLVDAVVPFVQTSFTRTLDNGTVTPTAKANAAVPIPTLAFTHNFGLERMGFGIALIVPPGYTAKWPSTVDGQPAPQRYSILDANGSFLGALALGAAYQLTDNITIGGALYLQVAQLGGTVAVSACDYAFCSQPEAPEWEGRTRFLLGPAYAATGNFGITADFDWVRLGASVLVRSKFSGQAKFALSLPDQYIFDGVQLQGQGGSKNLTADMSLVMPTIMRFGAEFVPTQDLHVEVASAWERWSQQESITVRPNGVVATNVPSLGTVPAQPMTLARNMKDTVSVSLGGTYDLTRVLHRSKQLLAHAGLMYESSAFADKNLSPATIDTQKLMTSLGASVQVSERVFMDFSYGHLFMQNRHVTNSQVLLPAAIQPLPQDNDPKHYTVGDRPAIGNGKYAIEANFVGVGLRWKFDKPAAIAAATSAGAQATAPSPPPAAPVTAPGPAPANVAPATETVAPPPANAVPTPETAGPTPEAAAPITEAAAPAASAPEAAVSAPEAPAPAPEAAAPTGGTPPEANTATPEPPQVPPTP